MTVLVLTGWEHGVATLTAKGGGLGQLSGSPTVQSTIKRSGTYALKINPTAALQYVQYTISAAVEVVRFYVYYDVMPSVLTEVLMGSGSTTSGPRIRIDPVSSKFEVFAGTDPGTESSVTISTGQWYRIDAKFDWSTTNHTIEWQIDGVDQTTYSVTSTADTITNVRVGFATAATGTVYYDDLIATNISGDYPIGAGAVEVLKPSSDGTHNAGTIIQNNSSAVINGTTVFAWSLLDEIPPVLTDYVKQTGTGSGNYAEVNFEDTANTTIHGVQAILAYHSATTSTNVASTRIRDADGQETVVFTGDMSESSLFYKSAVIAVPAGGWSDTTVNGLYGRVGYATDASPNPYWDMLILEVAYGESSGPQTFYSTPTGEITPSGSVIKRTARSLLGTLTPSGQSQMKPIKLLTGAINPSGSLSKVNLFIRSLTGALSPNGVISRQIGRALAGVIAPAGVALKRTSRILAGLVTPIGVLGSVRLVLKSLLGSVSPNGSLTKTTAKYFAGVVSSGGSITKLIRRGLAGSTSPGGVLTGIRSVLKSLTGAIGPAGTLARQARKGFIGTVNPGGNLVRLIAKALSGGMSPGGVLGAIKSILKSLSGAVSPGGTILKRAQKVTAGSAGPAGSVLRRVNKLLSGAVSPGGILSGIRSFMKSLTGAVAPAGGLVRRIGRPLAGSLSPDGTVQRFISKLLSGVIAPSGLLVSARAFIRILGGVVSAGGELARQVNKSLLASIAASGLVSWTKSVSTFVGKVVAFTASLITTWFDDVTATRSVAFTSEVQPSIDVEMDAQQTIQFNASMRRFLFGIFYSGKEIYVMDTPRVGDVGTVIEMLIQEDGSAMDLSGATAKQIIFRKPDGSKLEKDASFKTDGTDGRLKYTIGAGDLDQVGVWSCQAKVIFAGGLWTSSINSFEVLENL